MTAHTTYQCLIPTQAPEGNSSSRGTFAYANARLTFYNAARRCGLLSTPDEDDDLMYTSPANPETNSLCAEFEDKRMFEFFVFLLRDGARHPDYRGKEAGHPLGWEHLSVATPETNGSAIHPENTLNYVDEMFADYREEYRQTDAGMECVGAAEYLETTAAAQPAEI